MTDLITWNPRVGASGDDRYEWHEDWPMLAGEINTLSDPRSLIPTVAQINSMIGMNQIVGEINRINASMIFGNASPNYVDFWGLFEPIEKITTDANTEFFISDGRWSASDFDNGASIRLIKRNVLNLTFRLDAVELEDTGELLDYSAYESGGDWDQNIFAIQRFIASDHRKALARDYHVVPPTWLTLFRERVTSVAPWQVFDQDDDDELGWVGKDVTLGGSWFTRGLVSFDLATNINLSSITSAELAFGFRDETHVLEDFTLEAWMSSTDDSSPTFADASNFDHFINSVGTSPAGSNFVWTIPTSTFKSLVTLNSRKASFIFSTLEERTRVGSLIFVGTNESGPEISMVGYKSLPTIARAIHLRIKM